MVAARPDFTTAVAATSAVIAAIGDDQLYGPLPGVHRRRPDRTSSPQSSPWLRTPRPSTGSSGSAAATPAGIHQAESVRDPLQYT